MFVDVPPDYVNYAPTIILAEAKSKQTQGDLAVGGCFPMQNLPLGNPIEFGPVDFGGLVNDYLYKYKSIDLGYTSPNVFILKLPVNGRLIEVNKGYFKYRPTPGFYGTEKIEALVEIGDYKVKAYYYIKVVDEAVVDLEEPRRRYCRPKGTMWKISEESENLPYAKIIDFSGGNPSFSQLSGPTLAQTTGTGPTGNWVEIGDRPRFLNAIPFGFRSKEKQSWSAPIITIPKVNSAPIYSNYKDHENHFHVYLQSPSAFLASSSMLLSDSLGVGIIGADQLNGNFIPPHVLAEIQNKLMSICNASENPVYNLPGMSGPVFGGAMPGGVVDYALRKFDIAPPVAYPLDSIKILKRPVYGDLIPSKNLHLESEGIEKVYYTYTPRGDFVGEDSAVFEVDVYGYKFEVNYIFKVSKQLNQNVECPSDPFFDGEDDLDDQGATIGDRPRFLNAIPFGFRRKEN